MFWQYYPIENLIFEKDTEALIEYVQKTKDSKLLNELLLMLIKKCEYNDSLNEVIENLLK